MSPFLLRRLSDENLGGRLASGEAAAFDELYRRYSHRLAAYGAHLLGDAASGDDVAQATLLKAYGALRDGSVPEQLRPWLFCIAHNVALDLVARRRELPFSDLPDRTREAPPYAGALVAALAWLPDRQRRVYVLREIHGLRIDETAAELGLTTPQVEQALFAARNRLAELLVFGGRLSCVSVRRLAAGPLDLEERRALKTHLRSCPACREAVGGRAKALTLIPLSPLEWLRGLASLGGAAPAAAKVGAAVATVTIATGASAPLVNHAARTRPPDAHARPLPAAPVHMRESKVIAAVTRSPAVAVAPVAVTTPASPVERGTEDRHEGSSGDTGEVGTANDGAAHEAEVEAEDRSGSSGPGPAAAPAAIVVAPPPEPDEHGGGSGVSGDGETGDGELGD